MQALEAAHAIAGGERLDRQRLGQAGHAFEQDVAVGEQPDEQAVDQMLLADNHASHFLLQRRTHVEVCCTASCTA